MGFDADDKNHKQACGKKESFKNPHEFRSYPGDSPKNGEKVINLCEKQRPSNGLLRSASADFRSPKSLFKSSSSGLIQKSSSGDLNSSKLRSLSAEPEFLRFWLEKDRAINKVDMRTSCKTQSASPSDKGLLLLDPSGVFFAEPCVILDSDSDTDEEEEATDDAVTVILKQSPYSSPAPGCISRSASLTMTPWSPRPLSPSSSSPESVSPPPRPPPPANYEPSDLYCSLPRNWRERKHFLFDS